MSHVVVVGASVAGVKLVQNLRSEGFTGAITLVDQESHPLYDRPPLSKKYLSGAASDPEIALTTAEALEGLRVETRFGVAATELDLARAEEHHRAAQLAHADLEGDAGAGRGLGEQQGPSLPGQWLRDRLTPRALHLGRGGQDASQV